MTFYHVSDANLGRTVTLVPKLPGTAGPKECARTPRVCFSPTVWQCLVGKEGTASTAAILHGLLYQVSKAKIGDVIAQPAVYRTEATLHKCTAKQVPDIKVSGEHWSKVPIKVKLDGYIDLQKLLKVGPNTIKVQLTKTCTLNVTRDIKLAAQTAVAILAHCY
jgi:hypothetical protein